MEEFITFNATWPWPWIRPHSIPSCITHRPLSTYQISHESEKLFVDGRTDAWTNVRKDGQTLRPASLCLRRLGGVDLTSKVCDTTDQVWRGSETYLAVLHDDFNGRWTSADDITHTWGRGNTAWTRHLTTVMHVILLYLIQQWCT